MMNSKWRIRRETIRPLPPLSLTKEQERGGLGNKNHCSKERTTKRTLPIPRIHFTDTYQAGSIGLAG
jgi:hypothetical protein